MNRTDWSIPKFKTAGHRERLCPKASQTVLAGQQDSMKARAVKSHLCPNSKRHITEGPATEGYGIF